MKNFNNLKMTMFDSTNASFKVGAEASFVKKTQAGGYNPLVFITDGNAATGLPGNAHLNPSIYLTFSFKGQTFEETKTLYTSYPQLYWLQEAFETMKNRLLAEDAFIEVGGVLSVNSKYIEPIVLDNLGKQKKWMSLSLVAIETGENGVIVRVPGVSIQLSDATYASPLSREEFITVYTIVRDINLPMLQATFSSLFLRGNPNTGSPSFGGGPAFQQGSYNNNFPQQPWGRQQNTNQQSAYPKYNNTRFIASAPVQPVTPTQTPAQPGAPVFSPKNNVQQEKNFNSMPLRGEKPLINLDNVDEAEMSQVSFDDAEEIEKLFE